MDTGLKPKQQADPEALYRAEIDHLFAGPIDPSTHLGRILRHLADAHFGGREEALKEFAIAVDALGRPASFDPKLDSIVRVEVHKLRRLLREYYEGAGSSRPVSVLVAPGGYRLAFQRREGEAQSGAAGESATQPAVGSLIEASPAALEDSGPNGASAMLVSSQRKRRWKSTVRIAVRWAAAVAVVVLLWIAWSRRPSTNESSSLNASTLPPVANRPSITPSPSLPAAAFPIRISAGATEPYTDRNGRRWEADRFFDGGRVSRTDNPVFHYTRSPEVFRSRREGDFHYRVPVPPGTYEVRLYFAESQYGHSKRGGGGESSRIFRISINGQAVLDPIDVVADAGGPETALQRVFPGVRPETDGRIHVRFESLVNDKAFVNALEILPGLPDRALPRRLAVGTRNLLSPSGEHWEAEDAYTGGRLNERTRAVTGGPFSDLFGTERFGNFRYRLPAVRGHRYSLILWAAEQYFEVEVPTGRVAPRQFDILADGIALLQDLRILDEAQGGLKAWSRTFRGLEGAPQGYLELHLRPDFNYAVLNGLEWIDEGPVPPR